MLKVLWKVLTIFFQLERVENLITPDSQILFHKSFDLVNSLTSRQLNEINEAKNFKVVNLNKKYKNRIKKN